MATELKPCPFCGQTDRLEVRRPMQAAATNPEPEGGRTGRQVDQAPPLGGRVRHRATGRRGTVMVRHDPDPRPLSFTIAFDDGGFGGPYTPGELELDPPPAKEEVQPPPLDHQDRLAP